MVIDTIFLKNRKGKATKNIIITDVETSLMIKREASTKTVNSDCVF